MNLKLPPHHCSKQADSWTSFLCRKLNEVRKRLNELRELVHYYEQTSDMMTDAVNENTKEEEETEDSECDSDHENPQPVTNIR